MSRQNKTENQKSYFSADNYLIDHDTDDAGSKDTAG